MAGTGMHDAGNAHVRVEGNDDAPTLVMLHGFSGSLKWFDRLVDRLVPSFRIVRLDLLGHGATGGSAADAPAQARMVDAVLARLGIEDATALGHSFGADVAVELAESSTRITRLVIVAQAPDYSDANLPRGRALMTVPFVSTAVHRAVQPVGRALLRVAARRNRGRPGARRAGPVRLPGADPGDVPRGRR